MNEINRINQIDETNGTNQISQNRVEAEGKMSKFNVGNSWKTGIRSLSGMGFGQQPIVWRGAPFPTIPVPSFL